jgi:tetratricopeptide (TPR) repeat protein
MRHRSLAVATLAWVLAECPGVTQGRGDYLALLDQYASGQTTDAVAAVAAWPEPRVRAAVKSLDQEFVLSPARRRTAVLLHGEAAFVNASREREPFHLDVARSFVGRLLGLPRVPSEIRDFVARFHALWAVVYCTRAEPGLAQNEINRGLAIDKNNRFVNLIAGALDEYRVAAREPNPRGTWYVREGNPTPRKLLDRAAQTYQEIIAKHPEFYEAKLRLGWVLALDDSRDKAREQLEVVAAQATRSDLAYLAHMFLGSLHERARRPADAAGEYEAARAVAPFQSSFVALMRIAAAGGENERVRSLVAELSEVPPDQDDPWSVYFLCGRSGESLLDGLRAEALRP